MSIELFINEFVEFVGGIRVDSLISKNVEFKNADYLFEFSQYILELKSLENDSVNTEAFKIRLDKSYRKTLQNFPFKLEDYKNEDEYAQHVWSDFHAHYLKSFSTSIQKLFVRANKQIKQTKENLRLNDFSGALWITNENNYGLEPNYLVEIIKAIMDKKENSSIEIVILANLGMPVEVNEKPSLYWIPFYREHSSEIAILFTEYLAHSWIKFLVEKRVIEKGAIHTKGSMINIHDVSESWLNLRSKLEKLGLYKK